MIYSDPTEYVYAHKRTDRNIVVVLRRNTIFEMKKMGKIKQITHTNQQ